MKGNALGENRLGMSTVVPKKSTYFLSNRRIIFADLASAIEDGHRPNNGVPSVDREGLTVPFEGIG